MANNIKRFFLFANNRESDYQHLDEFLYNHPDYNDESVAVFFNDAENFSLKFKSALNFNRKWLIVRPRTYRFLLPEEEITFKDHKDQEFVGLDSLHNIDFERFYICPEPITKHFYQSKLLQELFEEYTAKNIDVSKWRHFKYYANKEQTIFKDKLNEHIHPAWRENPMCEEMTGNVRRHLTSGLWFYMYAKQEYANSKITMLYFSNKCSKTHSEKDEREYFLKELKDNNLEAFNSFI